MPMKIELEPIGGFSLKTDKLATTISCLFLLDRRGRITNGIATPSEVGSRWNWGQFPRLTWGWYRNDG